MGMIDRRTSNVLGVLTIKNYEKYQATEPQNEPQSPQNDRRPNAYKNEEKKKNEKKPDTASENDSLRRDIERQLMKLEIDSPAAYLNSILRATTNDWSAIKKAWGDWKRGVGIESPGDFFARCKVYHKQ